MKKVVSSIICTALLMGLAVPAFAEDVSPAADPVAAVTDVAVENGPEVPAIHVEIDGTEMEFNSDYGYPRELNDRVMLPVRQLFEHFGWQMVYYEEEELIMAFKDQSLMALQIGNKKYHFGDRSIDFDVAPTIIGDRTLVPVRVITEAMGFDVSYIEESRTVVITTGAGATGEVVAE